VESSHEYFDLLCAMVGANQASAKEEQLLAEHAESCAKCRQAVEHYRQIVWQIHEEELASGGQQQAVDLTEGEAAERAKAKERLLRELRGAVRLPLTGKPFGALPQHMTSRTVSRGGVPSWASWAVAASLLIAVGVNSEQYWESRRHSGNAETRTASLQKEVEGLRGELAKERAGRLRVVQPPQTTTVTKSGEIQKLQSENEALRQSLASSEAARQQEARDFTTVQDKERLLQSSLDVFQASKSTLEVENAGLSGKILKLTDDLRKSHEELAGLSGNEAVSQDALSKVKYVVDRQQKLLATDHDIRDILGSRSLHIIDVYDVGGQGELERPFGRIFYTEGKSLIFYAFDLDQQRGLKHGAVFQAWGQRGEGKENPRSLGTFYMDDSSQNRWVLRVDDNKALSRIDYVYVTDSSRKESVKPKGKPLLSAFLNGPANHP